MVDIQSPNEKVGITQVQKLGNIPGSIGQIQAILEIESYSRMLGKCYRILSLNIEKYSGKSDVSKTKFPIRFGKKIIKKIHE